MSEKFSARECALIAAKAADEHKATDIMVLEVGQLVDVTEYFVIATARNTPHVGAILEAMEDALRIECGVKPSLMYSSPKHASTIAWKRSGMMPLLSICQRRVSNTPNTLSASRSWSRRWNQQTIRPKDR